MAKDWRTECPKQEYMWIEDRSESGKGQRGREGTDVWALELDEPQEDTIRVSQSSAAEIEPNI